MTEKAGRARGRSPVYRPRRAEIVERFAEDDLLPAIYFVFSRAGCDDAVRQCLEAGLRLTTPAERRLIRSVADDHVEALSDADLRVLGYGRFVEGLEAGFAAHHAGLVPPFREAVEALFGAAIVKVVFATETLALGVNMPARSVVIEALSKFSGAGHEDLTAGNYTQLTGRAGRRGIDRIGHAAVLWSPYHTFAEVSALAAARQPRPAQLVPSDLQHGRQPRPALRPDDAYRLVRSSFAQYLSEAPLTRQLDAVLDLLGDRGYLAGWRVTAAGERLAGIYHDCDLLVAETVGAGLLGGLDAPGLAAVVSLFTFESRRAAPPAELPNARLAGRTDRARRTGAGPPRGRAGPAPPADAPRRRRFRPPRLRVGAGRRTAPPRLAAGPAGPAGAEAVSGGDFVRNMKQLVDLLRQLALTEAGSRLGSVAEGGRPAATAGSSPLRRPANPRGEPRRRGPARGAIHDRPGAVS